RKAGDRVAIRVGIKWRPVGIKWRSMGAPGGREQIGRSSDLVIGRSGTRKSLLPKRELIDNVVPGNSRSTFSRRVRQEPLSRSWRERGCMNGLFGSTVLDVAIGLIFVYLLLAIICTSLNEWI